MQLLPKEGVRVVAPAAQGCFSGRVATVAGLLQCAGGVQCQVPVGALPAAQQ
jgi:hypothetical protein